ncbi:flagellar biosynthesis protein FliR [Anaerotignum neopropionicum]|uniref:Flagellar biosynthesis protein FliR n=1 Tax=Anaerotignum neopropionicum TaxID=36847 RepID=A0A136WJI2_9FIRM|nr:flagellar biosynthetic protein FliR [Anaerotignum neopropionicum]KXL54550.1 flagellar biosynthesis protein FliR [Anaerotignum neopropionicum]
MDYVENFVFFSFVLMRMSGFIFLNPIFGRSNLPVLIKSGLVLALSMIVFTSLPSQQMQLSGMFEYGVLLLKEFAAGAAIGFVMSLFLFVIIFAGEVIDMQLGLSMSKVFDAQSNASIALSATYYNILFMLLFFSTNAHLAIIHILLNSSNIIPFGQVVLGQNVAQAVMDTFILCNELALKMAFPIIAIEFLCTIGMGILMKAIPQINVFVINFQLKIFIGLLVIFLIFSPMSDFLNQLVITMVDGVRNVFGQMA